MRAVEQSQVGGRRNSPAVLLTEARAKSFCSVCEILTGKGCVWVKHLQKQELLSPIVPDAWHACVRRAKAADRRDLAERS